MPSTPANNNNNSPPPDSMVPAGGTVLPSAQECAATLFQMAELGLHVYGRTMTTVDMVIDENMKDNPEEMLEIGEVINKKYRIERRIGKRTYIVRSERKCVVMHLEHASRTYDGPNLKRHGIAYLNIQSRLKNSLIHQKHFLQMYWCSLTHDIYQYLLVEQADCSVRELLTTVLQNRPLSRASALQISAQMLQGIHDFHLAGYTHRDIRPHNFFVGTGRKYQTIFIGGFDVCFDRFKARRKYIPEFLTPTHLPKVANVTARFQARAYHVGDKLCRIDDIESWIYTSIYLFCRDLLPWRDAENERRGFTSKCRLANGDYNLGELEKFFRPMLNAVRYRTLTDERVDFPFFAEILESMAKAWKITGKELLDWKVNPDGKVIAAQMDLWNKNNLASLPVSAVKASMNPTASTSNITGDRQQQRNNKKKGKLAARGGPVADDVERTQDTQEGSNALPVKPKNFLSNPKKKPVKVDEVERTQENDVSNAKMPSPRAPLLPKPKNNIIKSPKLNKNKKKEVSVDDATQDPEDIFPAINKGKQPPTPAAKAKPPQAPKKNTATEDGTQEEKVLTPVSPVAPQTSPGTLAVAAPTVAAPIVAAPGAAVAVKKEDAPVLVTAKNEKEKKEKKGSGSETGEDYVTPPSKASTKNTTANS